MLAAAIEPRAAALGRLGVPVRSAGAPPRCMAASWEGMADEIAQMQTE